MVSTRRKGRERADRNWVMGLAPDGIKTVGDPVISQPAARVNDVSEVRQLCKRMISRMRALHGQGLAAPQIGHSLQVITVETRPKDIAPNAPASPLYVMINPRIVSKGPRRLRLGWEGCFSVPGLMAKVPRFHRIEVAYLDRDGKKQLSIFTDFPAVVVQHEIDHLKGKIYLERAQLETVTTILNFKKLGLADT